MAKATPTEEFLVNLAKYPLRMMQFIGYCPYDVSETGHLDFSKVSKPILLWSILLLMLRIFHDYEFMVNYDVIVNLMSLQRSTDRLVLKVMVIMLSIATYWYRVYPLIYRKHLADFWYRNVKVVELVSSHEDFRIYPPTKYGNLPVRMMKMIKWTSFISILVTTYGVCFVAIVSSSWFNSGGTYETVENFRWDHYLAIYAWSFTTFFHGFLVTNMLYYMKIYTHIFGIVANEFHELNESATGMGVEEGKIFTLKSTKAFTMETLVQAEDKFRHGIDSFRWTQDLLMHYSSMYGSGVVIEIGTSTVLILVYAYLAAYWASVGQYMTASGTVFILWHFGYKIYALTTESYNMASAARKMARETILICGGNWLRDSSLLGQAKMLAMKVLIKPPSISPGNFFDLDRTIIVSILASGATYLIIMVQFREAENAGVLRSSGFSNVTN